MSLGLVSHLGIRTVLGVGFWLSKVGPSFVSAVILAFFFFW